MRASGRTTRALLALGENGFYMCPTVQIADFVRRRACELGRGDIRVVNPAWLDGERWRGHRGELQADHTFYEWDLPQRVLDKFTYVRQYFNAFQPKQPEPKVIASSVPKAIRDLVDSIPTLHVHTETDRYMRGGPPRGYIERHHAQKMAYELEPYLTHESSYEPMTDRDIVRSTITKPLSRLELTSLVSRAYEAGRQSR